MTNTTDPAQGTTGQGAGPGSGPGGRSHHGLDGLYDALRRPGIARASDGRWFAGVSAGIARWLGVDPLVVRAGFILFSIFFGMGIGLYLVLWLLMPDERGRISLEQALKHGEGHSIFLLVVTVIAVLGGGPWWDGDMHGFRFGGFVLLAFLTWWFLTRTDAGRDLMRSAPWRQTPAASADPEPPTAMGGPTPTMSTGNAAANAGAAPWSGPGVHPIPVPTPPKERTRGVGFAPGLLVLGAAILAGAGMHWTADRAGWDGSDVAIGIASGLGVLGLGILVAGIAGRRSGWLAPFAVLAMGASVFASIVPAGLTSPWQVGERIVQVTALDEANDYQLGLGELRVDLTGADFEATPAEDQVTAVLGMGELTLVVPDGVRVDVNARGRAGELLAFDSNHGLQFERHGTSLRETVQYGGTEGPAAIVVDAEVGLGQITVRTGATR